MLVLTIDVLRWYTAYPCYLRGTTIECLCRQVQTVLRSGHLVITSRESCLVWPLATEVEIGQTAMDMNEALGVLRFLYDAERLKNVYRTSWTSGGQPESVASHTWRLSLMALIFERSFPDVDIGRLLKMCIVHDLGEAIGGDIPAIYQQSNAPKADQERKDLLVLLEPLPDIIKHEILALWDDYEAAASPEARIAKALDKLETLLQHNQGANPPDFDYTFNLEYGRKFTDAVPLAAALRSIIDAETKQKAAQANVYSDRASDE